MFKDTNPKIAILTDFFQTHTRINGQTIQIIIWIMANSSLNELSTTFFHKFKWWVLAEMQLFKLWEKKEQTMSSLLSNKNEFLSIKPTNFDILTDKSLHILKSTISTSVGWFVWCQIDIWAKKEHQKLITGSNWALIKSFSKSFSICKDIIPVLRYHEIWYMKRQ